MARPGGNGSNAAMARGRSLNGTDRAELQPGDVFVIETPGGGGMGQRPDRDAPRQRRSRVLPSRGRRLRRRPPDPFRLLIVQGEVEAVKPRSDFVAGAMRNQIAAAGKLGISLHQRFLVVGFHQHHPVGHRIRAAAKPFLLRADAARRLIGD